MDDNVPDDGLQLQSLVKASGELELSLLRIATPEPEADEVVLRIEATPINPSDIGLLFGAADLATLTASGHGEHIVVTARVPQAAMKSMGGRLEQSMPVGNEGAGTVVRAGSGSAAQALLGRTVAVLAGAMYSQYRTVKAELCLPLPTGTTAAEGASCFVNPLTALGMVETMRREGHKALVHTAAASNLGQMLNRICLADGIGLVNIVRKPEQETLLRAQGATQIVSTASPSFIEDLTQALAATGATLAFDATGGGKLAGQILGAMEAALNLTAREYSRYGSTTHKQVYIYGGSRHRPDRVRAELRYDLGHGRLAAVPLPAAHRPRSRASTTTASGLGAEDDLCQPIYACGLACRRAAARGDCRLWPARNGLEGAHRPEPMKRTPAESIQASRM